MRILRCLVLTVIGAAASVSAHSWVDCTDYTATITSNNIDNAFCKGFPRDFATYNGGGFGIDRGFNYQPTGTQPACITSFSSSSYTPTWPMATYQPGQKIQVVWPAKNHDVGVCTNPFIPDTTMQLYMDCTLTGARNPAVQDFAVASKLLIDWKSNGGSGFQNCPFFCDNPDKAACFQDVTIPTNIPAGTVCTFMWYWIFNPGTVPYTTCWEACIGGNCAGGIPTAPGTTGTPTPSATGTTGTPAPSASANTTRVAAAATNAPVVTSSPTSTCKNALYAQCGGIGFSGSTCCPAASSCKVLNNYYSQCLPSNTVQSDQQIPSSFSADGATTTNIGNSNVGIIGAVGGVVAAAALAAAGVIVFKKRRMQNMATVKMEGVNVQSESGLTAASENYVQMAQ